MPVLRIVQQYNNKSPLNGIIQSDNINFDSREDGMAWVAAVKAMCLKGKLDWDLLDYEWAILTTNNCEVLKNPTGGYVGSLIGGAT